MTRIDTLENRIFSVQPASPVKEILGPRIARARMGAAAIAGDPSMSVPGAEVQTENAIEQMTQGAELHRVAVVTPTGQTIQPDDWMPGQEPYWIFQPQNETYGASGQYLDFWGAILQIARNPPETDATYARRMLAESILPALTNVGMAKLIDGMLGCNGTVVTDAWIYLDQPQLTDPEEILPGGYRLCDGTRLAADLVFGALSLWNCFIVFLPVDLPFNGQGPNEVTALIERRKAAGFRKIALICVPSGTVYP